MEVDTIDSIDDVPSAKLNITYPNGKTVEFGQELTPSEVKEEPQVQWEADDSKFYTLLMFDPDAPSREKPTLADVKHWLVVNIQGSDLSTGEVIAPYMGSGAPKGSGLHRYIFLVFDQEGKLEFDEPKSGKMSRDHRISWSMRAFRKKYKLGRAFAGNFFKAQWDPYVEEFRKQLSQTSA